MKGQTAIGPRQSLLSRMGEKQGEKACGSDKDREIPGQFLLPASQTQLGENPCGLLPVKMPVTNKDPKPASFPPGHSQGPTSPLTPRARQGTDYAPHLPVSLAAPSPSRPALPGRGLSAGSRADLLQPQALLGATLLFPALALTPFSSHFCLSSTLPFLPCVLTASPVAEGLGCAPLLVLGAAGRGYNGMEAAVVGPGPPPAAGPRAPLAT